MENSLSNTQPSLSSMVRHRKSIFASQKPKPDDQQPKLLLNGETLTDWRPVKSSTSPNFYTPKINENSLLRTDGFVQSKFETRPLKGSFYLPQNSYNRVIITDSNHPQCIRPSSVGKRSVVFNTHQIIQKPAPIINSQVMPQQKQVLASSIIVPSQSSNVFSHQISNLTKTSGLKRKCILMEGKPHESVIFRHSPIKQQPVQIIKQQPVQIIQQIRPQISRIIIQDDPKTISELNKLNSLNQFLTHQYNLINNELIEIKNKTSQKEVVEQKTFLQKSLNRIDDIFMRQTNQALFKLDEISRCSSSKGFTGFSQSKMKRNPSPGTNKKSKNNQQEGVFTPIKVVQQMQNSSYMECPHHDYLNV